MVESLPRKQTRVLTWPLATVFPFIAQPKTHIFLKPNTTKEAARVLNLPFPYVSRPNGRTYAEYVALAKHVRAEIADLRPRDMIDVQSFLWVQGRTNTSEECRIESATAEFGALFQRGLLSGTIRLTLIVEHFSKGTLLVVIGRAEVEGH